MLTGREDQTKMAENNEDAMLSNQLQALKIQVDLQTEKFRRQDELLARPLPSVYVPGYMKVLLFSVFQIRGGILPVDWIKQVCSAFKTWYTSVSGHGDAVLDYLTGETRKQ